MEAGRRIIRATPPRLNSRSPALPFVGSRRNQIVKECFNYRHNGGMVEVNVVHHGGPMCSCDKKLRHVAW